MNRYLNLTSSELPALGVYFDWVEGRFFRGTEGETCSFNGYSLRVWKYGGGWWGDVKSTTHELDVVALAEKWMVQQKLELYCREKIA